MQLFFFTESRTSLAIPNFHLNRSPRIGHRTHIEVYDFVLKRSVDFLKNWGPFNQPNQLGSQNPVINPPFSHWSVEAVEVSHPRQRGPMGALEERRRVEVPCIVTPRNSGEVEKVQWWWDRRGTHWSLQRKWLLRSNFYHSHLPVLLLWIFPLCQILLRRGQEGRQRPREHPDISHNA